MWTKVCVVFLVCVLYGLLEIESKSLPPYIIPCNRDDPNIAKCIIDHTNEAVPHFKNGDKQYKISSLKPIRINEAILQPSPNIKLIIRNVDTYGLDEMTMTNASLQYKDNIYNINFTVAMPQLKIISDYEIDGRILILPISGKGKASFIFDNPVFNFYSTVSEKDKKGVKVVKIDDIKQTWSCSGLTFDLENLFNGDKVLGPEMNKFLNENWMEVIKELGPSFGDIVATVTLNFVRQVVQDVPADEVFLHN